ncbi:Shedu anti-phage system protein SduA domain-containing protein [Pseudonocardia alni]|uniref:Shedu anti-phage system protein SduA domain-containing protein n=1 Tax=Pseudonocardia alni TaxID=33907 RepID=UPI003723AE6A
MKTAIADHDPDRPQPPSWQEYVDWLTPRWDALLASDPAEPAVQSFLEQHPCLIPGAHGDVGPGGHHGPVLGGVFAEPPLQGLDKHRRPDFMWITRSTSLITPICIEIERPGKHWFTSGGVPTAQLTQALDQLTDWKVWFSESENQAIFRKQYIAGEHEDRQLLPQYVLIFGRQREFDRSYGRHERPDRLRKKRDFMRRENEFFMTFDSLRPDAQDSDLLTLRMSSNGPRVLAVPPTFTTGPSTQDDAKQLKSIEDALSRTPLITDARRAHIRKRWEHWRNEDDSAKIRELQLGE